MIAFALMLNLCAAPVGCAWLVVEFYDSEEDCLAAGKLWTADCEDQLCDIAGYKCVLKMKPADWGKDE
jgi:hypothetical protein